MEFMVNISEETHDKPVQICWYVGSEVSPPVYPTAVSTSESPNSLTKNFSVPQKQPAAKEAMWWSARTGSAGNFFVNVRLVVIVEEGEVEKEAKMRFNMKEWTMENMKIDRYLLSLTFASLSHSLCLESE